MKKYLFSVPATCITGFQVFEISANSEDEARKLILNGGGEIVESELEVESLDFKQMELMEEE